MMREIEDKSLQILEEERRIATNIANPTSRFAGALSLWEKIREKAEQKAREYAGKTRDRFLIQTSYDSQKRCTHTVLPVFNKRLILFSIQI